LKVPLCYRPIDTRKQNIPVDIPGGGQQVLVLNDVVAVDIEYVEEALRVSKSPWRLGYAATIHSSQGLTIEDTTVWIIDNRIEWSNLVYLAVSRVRRINQLRRIFFDEESPMIQEISITENINKKLSGYKQQDKIAQREFDIDEKLIIALRDKQKNHCACCNCIMRWCYQVGDSRQFTVDRINNNLGHISNNVRLTCLECNRRHDK
jgi:hypothetical protein